MKIKAIITGATGMVGEGVLHECLLHPDVEKVLVINRKPCEIKHEKLTEIIHADFFNLSSIESQLSDYNACFFCLGVSSIGLKADEYYKITYTLTINFAEALLKANTNISFCYVSGAGTDSTEKGKMSWARVKGKTENDLMKMPFAKVYAFRPGFMKPTPGLKNTHTYYKLFTWLFPFFRLLLAGYVSTLSQLGLAMINAILKGYDSKVIEVNDIIKLSKK